MPQAETATGLPPEAAANPLPPAQTPSVLSGEELRIVSDYVSRKVAEIGREILDGTISLNPL